MDNLAGPESESTAIDLELPLILGSESQGHASSSVSQAFPVGALPSGAYDVGLPLIMSSPTFESPFRGYPRRSLGDAPVSRRSVNSTNSRRFQVQSSPGFMHLATGTPRAQDSPWSLFGQLMENEGQLRGSRPKERSGSVLDQTWSSLSGVAESDSVLIDPFLEQPPPASAYPATESVLPNAPNNITEPITTPMHTLTPIKMSFYSWRFPHIPVLYRNIVKCAVAYFIASLFTFSPYLSGFISDITSYGSGERRPSPSGHLVATV
jgi:hypothetical protein